MAAATSRGVGLGQPVAGVELDEGVVGGHVVTGAFGGGPPQRRVVPAPDVGRWGSRSGDRWSSPVGRHCARNGIARYQARPPLAMPGLAEARGIPLHVLLGQPGAAQRAAQPAAQDQLGERPGAGRRPCTSCAAPGPRARIAQAIARWCGVESTVRLRSRSGWRSAKAHATDPPQSWPTRCTRGLAERVEQGEHVGDQLGHPVGRASVGQRAAASSRAGRRPPPAARPRRAGRSPAPRRAGPGASRAAADHLRAVGPSPLTPPLSLTSKTRPSRVNSLHPANLPGPDPRPPGASAVRDNGA